MAQEFTAEIKKQENIDGAYVEVPFDVESVFGAKRVKVKALFDNILYRGSIVRMNGRYLIGMTKALRAQIGKNPGDSVQVKLEKDVEERLIELPELFKKALEENKAAKAYFEGLSYTNKKEYVEWITAAKRAETQLEHITRAIQKLNENKKLK